MTDERGTVLLVDDDAAFRNAARRALERRGYVVDDAESGAEALNRQPLCAIDAAVVDLRMPGMDGLQLLKELRRHCPFLSIIVLTGHGTISTAIEAIQSGAFHYLTKPCEMSELDIYLQKAIDNRRILRANKHLRDSIHRSEQTHGIIGNSPAIQRLLDMIDRVKDADSPALIAGKSGTGKELVARALHYQSRRSDTPFIALSCATLKPELLESELFGYEPGTYPGATSRKEGLLAIADRGTLLIDDIANMDFNLQASLLRVIETGEYRPLGSTKEQKTSARILAAVNRDLQEEVKKQRFREDLFYRLSVVVIQTPCLSEHLEDIPLLVESFIQRSAFAGKGIQFTPDALRCLQAYQWPGNVRELFNICERAILLRSSDNITESDIAALLHIKPPVTKSLPITSPSASDLKPLDQMECEHIRYVLEQTENNISKTADILGIDRRTLQRKMDRYGLERNSG